MSTLQHRCAVSIAVSILNKFLAAHPFRCFFTPCFNFEDDLTCLPVALRRDVLDAVSDLVDELQVFSSYVTRVLSSHHPPKPRLLFRAVRCTDRGRIDRLKMMEDYFAVYYRSNLHDTKVYFEEACYFCLETWIRLLWMMVPRKGDIESTPFTRYWVARLMGRRPTSDDMLLESIRTNNLIAIEYFWKMSSAKQDFAFLLPRTLIDLALPFDQKDLFDILVLEIRLRKQRWHKKRLLEFWERASIDTKKSILNDSRFYVNELKNCFPEAYVEIIKFAKTI